MELVSRDDEDALEVLLHRYRPRLTTYVVGIISVVDAAEDVVQETFVRLWERRGRWIPGGSVQAYLYQTARNLVLCRARSLGVRKRTVPQVIGALNSAAISPFDDAVSAELRESIHDAIGCLPRQRRTALILVRIQGLSLAEAAEVMGRSRQTIANHISLALDDLEIALRDFRD